MPADAPSDRHAAKIWLALGIVYVVWSTTYLAIRVVNETLPPLIAAGVRFLIAGGVLYAWAIRRGDREGDRPGYHQWRAAAIIGACLIVFGNGFVVLGEKTVPTGITALLIALVPLWMALIDRALLGHIIRPRIVVGLILGFGGAAMLIGGSAIQGGAPASGMLIVVVASLSWASGSLYSRTAPLPARPLVGAGMEFLCGGVMLVILGGALGESGRIHADGFSRASVIALVYLITVGSWIAFASYLWLLRNARTSLVSTYAYVNPALAVALGTVFLNETIAAREIVAGAVILAAVALIISAGGAGRETGQTLGGDERRAQEEGEILLEGVRGAEQHELAQDRSRELQADGQTA